MVGGPRNGANLDQSQKVQKIFSLPYPFRFIDSQPFHPIPALSFRPLACYRVVRNEVPMTQIELTPPQQAVIDAVCSGDTVHQAAASANVRLEDILGWRHNLPHFEAALKHALSERDLLNREKAMTMADLAYQTIGDILRDDKASPSVQFKAARFIIEQATPHVPSEPKQHRNAAKPAPAGPRMPPNCTRMPTAADFAGFNEACPCGSGKKFTDCCLSKYLSGAA